MINKTFKQQQQQTCVLVVAVSHTNCCLRSRCRGDLMKLLGVNSAVAVQIEHPESDFEVALRRR